MIAAQVLLEEVLSDGLQLLKPEKFRVPMREIRPFEMATGRKLQKR
jgi:hypothetical protein